MRFALIGPNQGKSGVWGNFRFVKGIAEVPDDAEDAHRLLGRYYAAHPVHHLQKNADGRLELKPVQPEPEMEEVDFGPIDFPPAFTPSADQELDDASELDPAGAVRSRRNKKL